MNIEQFIHTVGACVAGSDGIQSIPDKTRRQRGIGENRRHKIRHLVAAPGEQEVHARPEEVFTITPWS